jgi:DNA-binding LytR/AlgR family response regulator
MAKITLLMTTLRSNLSYVALLPVFWLCFVLLYQPQMWVGILSTQGFSINFNATIILCILLGVMLLSRGILLAVHRTFTMTWAKMIIWELAELVVMSMFTALYITLMFHGEFAYFYIVGKSLYALLLTMIYPYLILNLAYAYAGKVIDDTVYDDSLMRFQDNTQKLKLMIASSAVLYVEADENYVHIRYLEGERIKDYPLRASMKSLEELMLKHGLLRCQRSYYINPQHIKVLRRDKEGMISAELDVPNLKPIPVSPRYYDAVAKWL